MTPVPKPLPSLPKPRQHNSTLAARSEGPRKVNRKRQAKEMPRKYGTPTRRRWVKAQDCSACSVEGFSVNAHVGHAGAGAGRKANADQIAPLCKSRFTFDPVFGKNVFVLGCHTLLDDEPSKFRARFPWWNAGEQCALTEKKWQAYVERGGDGSELDAWEESA